MEIFPVADRWGKKANPNPNPGHFSSKKVRKYPKQVFRSFVRTPNLFYQFILELKLSSENLEICPVADR